MTTDNPSGFSQNKSDPSDLDHKDIVRLLLVEINRVKGLITHYENTPDSESKEGIAILTELVTEAQNSLINYDTELMLKYYDLLRHCD